MRLVTAVVELRTSSSTKDQLESARTLPRPRTFYAFVQVTTLPGLHSARRRGGILSSGTTQKEIFMEHRFDRRQQLKRPAIEALGLLFAVILGLIVTSMEGEIGRASGR